MILGFTQDIVAMGDDQIFAVGVFIADQAQTIGADGDGCIRADPPGAIQNVVCGTGTENIVTAGNFEVNIIKRATATLALIASF